MIVVDVEPHPDHDGHWRWLLIDLTTGERALTGTQPYWAECIAERLGERQLRAMTHTPVIDTTTEDPFT